MRSPQSIYIPIGITYRNYKAEYFAACIDNGSATYLCKPDCFPEEEHKQLKAITGIDISRNAITVDKGIETPRILLGSFLIKCPPFYFHDTGTDILLGNNFLQLFEKVLYDTLLFTISFKTPCRHWITAKCSKNAYAKPRPITFKRRSQHGDLGYKQRPLFPV